MFITRSIAKGLITSFCSFSSGRSLPIKLDSFNQTCLELRTKHRADLRVIYEQSWLTYSELIVENNLQLPSGHPFLSEYLSIMNLCLVKNHSYYFLQLSKLSTQWMQRLSLIVRVRGSGVDLLPPLPPISFFWVGGGWRV